MARNVVAVREADAADAAAPAGALDYEALLAAASPALAAADTHRDDVALWGYTSGSTGAPKAAVHAHRDLVCAADLVGVGAFGIGPDDRDPLGVEALLRLRPRQLAVLSGARGRGVDPGARASGARGDLRR